MKPSQSLIIYAIAVAQFHAFGFSIKTNPKMALLMTELSIIFMKPRSRRSRLMTVSAVAAVRTGDVTQKHFSLSLNLANPKSDRRPSVRTKESDVIAEYEICRNLWW